MNITLKPPKTFADYFNKGTTEMIHRTLIETGMQEMEQKRLRFNIVVGAILDPLTTKNGRWCKAWVEFRVDIKDDVPSLTIMYAIIYAGSTPLNVLERSKTLSKRLLDERNMNIN